RDEDSKAALSGAALRRHGFDLVNVKQARGGVELAGDTHVLALERPCTTRGVERVKDAPGFAEGESAAVADDRAAEGDGCRPYGTVLRQRQDRRRFRVRDRLRGPPLPFFDLGFELSHKA